MAPTYDQTTENVDDYKSNDYLHVSVGGICELQFFLMDENGLNIKFLETARKPVIGHSMQKLKDK